MALTNVFVSIVLISTFTKCEWTIVSNPSLPDSTTGMAVGSYGPWIFLLGGRSQNDEVWRMDTKWNSFTKESVSIPSRTYAVNSQYYTSIDYVIYFLTDDGSNYISTYDMSTNLYTYQWAALSSATSERFKNACLTSTTHYLFVIGGYSTATQNDLSSVKVLSLSNTAWLTNVPSMSYPRRYGACVGDSSHDKVYAIGGMDIKTNEILYLDDIASNAWIEIDSLMFTDCERAVLYKNTIYVFDALENIIHLIDTNTDTVSISSETIPYENGLNGLAVVIVEDVMFAFGGDNDDVGTLNTWMYYTLPSTTEAPTTTQSITAAPASTTTTTTTSTTAAPTSTQSTTSTTTTSTTKNVYTSTTSTTSTTTPTANDVQIKTSDVSSTSNPMTSAAASSIETIKTTSDEFPFCSTIITEIVNLKGVSAYAFNTEQELQVFIVNITFLGIAKNADDYGIDADEFRVKYGSASHNINISQSVCIETENMLNVLHVVIDERDINISEHIREQTVKYFADVNGVSTNNVTTDIHWGSYDSITPPDEPISITEVPSLYITVSVLGLFSLFALISLFDAKCIRRNDYFAPTSIVMASFEVSDSILDLLFAVALLLLYVETNKFNILIASIASLIFVIIPIVFSIFQLVQKAEKSWFKDDDLNNWLKDKIKILYFLSIITGSSYTAIEIVNCGAFQLEIFNMGLNTHQRIKFNTKRVIGVVCLENLPQMGIQIWYFINFGAAFLPILSLIFSVISIALVVLTTYSQRKILKIQEIITIEFDVIGDEIKPIFATKTDGVKEAIANLLGLKTRSIEIQPLKPVPQGLKFVISLFISNHRFKEKGCESTINKAKHNEKLAKIIKEQWELSSLPNIDNVKFIATDGDVVQIGTVSSKGYTSIKVIE